ncbi:MAG: arsenate reductase (glutaredoxin) [Campylobacterales bacterium]|nr:arsenate reductase (glutaredoxin) [Campylobacterales bacterium]
MHSTVTIWHNPRCGKSREALKLIEKEGIAPDVVRYLDNAPGEAELRAVLKMLGIGARDLMRTKEAIYKELGLKDVTDEAALIKAMAEHPKLIERPVVITNGKAVIGRPPEKVVDLVKA